MGRASATTTTTTTTSTTITRRTTTTQTARLLLTLRLLLPLAAGVSASLPQKSPPQDVTPVTYTLGFVYDGTRLPKYHVGALAVAVDEFNKAELKDLGVKLNFLWNKTDGSNVKSVQVMTQFRERGVHGFIGPGHTACLTEAIVATAWNIPLISFVSCICPIPVLSSLQGPVPKHIYIMG